VAVNHVGKDRISKELSGFERTLGRPIDILKVDQAAYSSEIERCQRVCGSPLLSHSFAGQAIQSAFVRAAGCRVLFGGEGGDELFGGYPCYLEKRNSNGRFSPSLYTTHNDPKIEFIADDPTDIQNDLSEAWRRSLEAYKNIQDRKTQVLQAMMYCDLAYQLPSVCLRAADLMSMMWSVEARSAFLRRPIVSFMLNVPSLAKSDNREGINPLLRTKPLLKKLFLRYYSTELLSVKQGFSGFPNESAVYLGNMMDYLTLDFLGIRKKSIQDKLLDKATAWKLVNIEYFLRWNQ
jgi:asparagine synthetase B (glutamine-hydrolysing)